VLFSTGGAAIKACSLSGWQVASFRSAIAALAVFAFVPASRGGWTRRTFAVGIAYAATMILFVSATKLTTAANAIFLQSAAPLYLILLAPWLLRERIRFHDLVFTAVIGSGLAMFFVGTERAYATAPDPFTGNILGVTSGLCWALTVLGLRGMARSEHAAGRPAAVAVLAGNLIAFLVCLPMALPVARIGPADGLVLGYLGIFQIGLAYLCLTHGMRTVAALEASLLLLVEPILNPLWAWLVQGEKPARWALAGGGVILLATALKTWKDSRLALSLPRPASLRE